MMKKLMTVDLEIVVVWISEGEEDEEVVVVVVSDTVVVVDVEKEEEGVEAFAVVADLY